MQVGIITVDGLQVGVIAQTEGDDVDDFTPDLDGYEPEGRADEAPLGGHGTGHHYVGHPKGESGPAAPQAPRMRAGGEGDTDPLVPQPKSGGASHARQGSRETDNAIVEAAKAHNLDPNMMRAVASIESDMNPSSNANRSTQYKGLYQIGHGEWERFGNGGNIYNAKDNAMAAARMFAANRDQFRKNFHRDPTDAEMYMMHQQGLGFYTRGAMTNIGGNRYPGMRGEQTHDSFEKGWGRELERRKAGFSEKEPTPSRSTVSPGAVKSPSGDPAAFIMHHTGGGRTPEDIQNTLHQRGLGVQYIMDREGNISQAGGHSHMLPGWGKGEGLSNRNTVGMEVIAKDDKDVTPAQVRAARQFIEKNYPDTPVFGHGEVNPGHKEADEGMTIVNAIRADRSKPRPASATTALPPKDL